MNRPDQVTSVVPYPEGSINALLEFMRNQRIPGTDYVRAPVKQAVAARSLGGLQRALTGAGSQGETAPESGRTTSYVGGGREALRLALTVLGSQKARRWAMYGAARAFDLAVAGRVTQSAGWVIGFPGASLATFQAAQRQGVRCAFHAVNAHPRAHNEILLEHHARNDVEGELVPSRVASRVEAELGLADLIVAPSNVVKRQMVDAGIGADRVKVVPFGVNTARFSPTLAAATVVNGRPRVLFVGQISYRKGVDVLIKAAALAPVDVTLVGPIVQRRLLKALPANVRYVGTTSSEGVARLMAESDCLVLPSLEDACALVTVEGLAAGLPVVTTSANGATELIAADSLLVIPPGDTRVLSDALRSVTPLSLHARAANAALAGASSVGGLGWDDYARRYLEALAER